VPRLFVALELDAATRARAVAVAEALRSAVPARVRAAWTPADRLHVTLAFLGPVDAARIPDLQAILTRVAAAHPPARGALGSAGAFPRTDRARVIWLSFAAGDEPIHRRVAELGQRLGEAGFPLEDRAWTGHVTLVRFRERDGFDARDAIARLDAVHASCPVDALTLMESRPTPNGHTYIRIFRAPFCGIAAAEDV